MSAINEKDYGLLEIDEMIEDSGIVKSFNQINEIKDFDHIFLFAIVF